MPYKGGSLVDLAPPLGRGVDRMATRATREVGDFMRKRVRRHTPFAKPGTREIAASYRSTSDWIRARGGRRPGHLHDSWKVGEVVVIREATGERRRIDVYTTDPVAPHVEWDTVPHLILPKDPSGVLTIPTVGGMVYAKYAWHPGTKGVHMMATAVQETAVAWRGIVADEWAKEVRGLWRANVS